GRKLRRQIDIDHAGNAKAPKERTPPLVAPNDAVFDDCACLDLLARPQLDVRVDHRAFADDALIADHSPFKDHHFGLQAALAGDDRPAQFAVFADVVVAPENAAFDAAVAVDNGVVAHDARAVDGHIAFDFDAVAQKDRAEQLRAGRDVHVFAHPDAAADVTANRLGEFDLAIKHIGVGPAVLFDVAHVAPIAFGNVPIDGLAYLDHAREKLGRKVIGLACRNQVQNFRFEHINAGIDRVGDDLAPTRLLLKLGNAPFGV